MSKTKLILFGAVLIPMVIALSECLNTKKAPDPRGKDYAGSASCVSCHKSISESYLHTAHFISSQPADSVTIQGDFGKGHNEITYNPHTTVVMDKRKSGFYQIAYHDGKKGESGRFDIVFGGVKGQTYAYWLANELFQLPVSYVNDAQKWINSPGYQNSDPDFERMITSQCLGCHMSYAKVVPGKLPLFVQNPEGFDRATMIYNIDCERCHGPAEEHVKFQTANPTVKEAKYIATYRSLTREQKISMCAVCHSGANNVMLQPTFGFKPGDTLSKYMKIVPANLSADYRDIDVHGDQAGMLATSKCFISTNMSCATCHNTHQNERDKQVLFAARCMSCHTKSSDHECKLSGKLPPALLTSNCIDCHMPAFASKLIVAGKSGAMVHTHHIAVYPEETKKILKYLKLPAGNTR